MANNYCESSSFVEIPPDKLEKAKVIADRIGVELESNPDEGYAGYVAEFEGTGLWIHHNESLNPDHAERLVKALVEELDLMGIFVCSWSYTYSKPRIGIGEFGGGAFAVQKGRDTVWIDAASEAERQASLLKNDKGGA